jgi:DNA topoisomerase I
MYIMSQKQFITQRKAGKNYHYFLGGKRIENEDQINYYKSLRIPPAWEKVKISPSRRAHILATGIDRAGRLQYIYNPLFRARQERKKFERTLRFAQALPRMRRITAQHLKHRKLDREKVLACILRLMDQAYFRVGNDVYAKQNQSYGLTTIRSKHISVQGDTITFDFVGKSNKKHIRRVSDRALAKIIKKLDELPGYEIFKYHDESGHLRDVKSSDVNAYIKELMGEEFTAKDFRTWGGTLLASAALSSTAPAATERERKKTITTCVKTVAKKLGNTPAIARSSYIDPRLLNAYQSNNNLSSIWHTVQKMKKTAYLSPDEQCVLKVLSTAV